jgi:hypothetical protein
MRYDLFYQLAIYLSVPVDFGHTAGVGVEDSVSAEDATFERLPRLQ